MERQQVTWRIDDSVASVTVDRPEAKVNPVNDLLA
jgi:hypothetical protein